MRYAFLITGTALCIGLHHAWATNGAEARLDDTATLATEVRCGGQSGSVANNCRELHEKLFLAGTLDPETTLRSYCTPTRTSLNPNRGRPPAFCSKRYGGWLEG